MARHGQGRGCRVEGSVETLDAGKGTLPGGGTGFAGITRKRGVASAAASSDEGIRAAAAPRYQFLATPKSKLLMIIDTTGAEGTLWSAHVAAHTAKLAAWHTPIACAQHRNRQCGAAAHGARRHAMLWRAPRTHAGHQLVCGASTSAVCARRG